MKRKEFIEVDGLFFKRSSKANKKYDAYEEITNKAGKKVKNFLASFGDPNYEHFHDRIGLWSHLDHGDQERRKRYRQRHAKDDLKSYSPGYFSWNYLW